MKAKFIVLPTHPDKDLHGVELEYLRHKDNNTVAALNPNKPGTTYYVPIIHLKYKTNHG